MIIICLRHALSVLCSHSAHIFVVCDPILLNITSTSPSVKSLSIAGPAIEALTSTRFVNIGHPFKSFSLLSPIKGSGFVGQVRHFCINGLCPLDQIHWLPNARPRRWISEASAVISSVRPLSDIRTRPLTFKNQRCYLTLPALTLFGSFFLQLSFKTAQPNGLLFVNTNKRNGDFIVLEILDGQVRLTFNMGEGPQTHDMKTPSVSDNRWHSVQIHRPNAQQNVLDFRVNKESQQIQIVGRDKFRNLNLDGPLYVGGAPESLFSLPKWRESIASRQGFLGCLANFSTNLHDDKMLSNSDFITTECASDIVSGCQELHSEVQCSSIRQNNPYCLNGGQCRQHWTRIECSCDMTTFSGTRCDTRRSS
ncbi:Neurexin-3-beta [Cichlidogyrus casuarinus]|uniref:Neurexin-3-beta n=1 Tax=Cichlidogyrus casuarinus TaxID=1844966 RepID=A0ABD2QAE0_9PLAT